jgi:hypothetical protein
MSTGPRMLAEDAVLGLLAPAWQLIISAFVLIAVVVSIPRLARRGRSRMSTALLVTGVAVVGVATIGILFS